MGHSSSVASCLRVTNARTWVNSAGLNACCTLGTGWGLLLCLVARCLGVARTRTCQPCCPDRPSAASPQPPCAVPSHRSRVAATTGRSATTRSASRQTRMRQSQAGRGPVAGGAARGPAQRPWPLLLPAPRPPLPGCPPPTRRTPPRPSSSSWSRWGHGRGPRDASEIVARGGAARAGASKAAIASSGPTVCSLYETSGRPFVWLHLLPPDRHMLAGSRRAAM